MRVLARGRVDATASRGGRRSVCGAFSSGFPCMCRNYNRNPTVVFTKEAHSVAQLIWRRPEPEPTSPTRSNFSQVLVLTGFLTYACPDACCGGLHDGKYQGVCQIYHSAFTAFASTLGATGGMPLEAMKPRIPTISPRPPAGEELTNRVIRRPFGAYS